MSTSEKQGRPFERLVAAVQAKLDPSAQVHSPFAVIGASGARITLDAAVRGTVKDSKILVAIEAKDYAPNVGVEKVRAFVTVLKDIGANHGIMISRRGFTRDSLLTAAHFGVETCVLRRANDDDWEGFNRGHEATITSMITRYCDASVVLADGQVIPVDENGLHLMWGEDGSTKFFDSIVNSHLATHPGTRDQPLRLTVLRPLTNEMQDGRRVAVAELRCTPRLVPGLSVSWIDIAPEDCVFAKLTPDGQLDERAFFTFAELEQLAERFVRSSVRSEPDDPHVVT